MTDKEFQNLEVGKTFYLGNKKLWVSESDKKSCEYCMLNNEKIDCATLLKIGVIPECYFVYREDNKSVVFIEVENED
ncbi:hypothetical protein [uncultured Fusobacterium sp.]|uniref:hypothetical protein n=1 Tax=uncultured Fusobacterium sp. TaxID=159267 RepID=UPI0025CC6FB4|nr:hypothetical protein [uncultured Fusobacterium sp.]